MRTIFSRVEDEPKEDIMMVQNFFFLLKSISVITIENIQMRQEKELSESNDRA